MARGAGRPFVAPGRLPELGCADALRVVLWASVQRGAMAFEGVAFSLPSVIGNEGVSRGS